MMFRRAINFLVLFTLLLFTATMLLMSDEL